MDDDRELAPLLARAGILMFEYDVDGSLLMARGSCLGGLDPATEVRAGLVTPSVARTAAEGHTVISHLRLSGRAITVRHEPVRDEQGDIVKIVATACRDEDPDVADAADELEPTERTAQPATT